MNWVRAGLICIISSHPYNNAAGRAIAFPFDGSGKWGFQRLACPLEGRCQDLNPGCMKPDAESPPPPPFHLTMSTLELTHTTGDPERHLKLKPV